MDQLKEDGFRICWEATLLGTGEKVSKMRGFEDAASRLDCHMLAVWLWRK